MSSPQFTDLPLSPALLKNISSLGYTQPTPIQSAALPLILEGRDVLGQAKTGSGKTAAFSLGFLQQLDPTSQATQALVICPVRELAEQVAVEIRRLARCIPNIKLVSLCGGMPWRAQEKSMQNGAHIVVGTPGRIAKHLRKDLLDVSQLKCLVLDEADRLLDMGFLDEVSQIVRQTPGRRQTLLFSATFPEDVITLSRKIQKKAEHIAVDTTLSPKAVVHQDILASSSGDKHQALARILHKERADRALVFCATRDACREVSRFLKREGYSVAALHGEMEQRDRSDALIRFTNQSLTVLVATDVAARGLDIEDLPLVVNYDPARTPDIHTHRLGRTGRAGRKGKAYSLCQTRKPGALDWKKIPPVDIKAPPAPMVSFTLNGGKKQKIRPGEILGALIKEAGLPSHAVGKIYVSDTFSVVAVLRDHQKLVKSWAETGRIKGKRLSVF